MKLDSETKRALIVGIIMTLIICGALVLRSVDQSTSHAPENDVQQTMVRVTEDGESFPLNGYELSIDSQELNGHALPVLQRHGWRIVSVRAPEANGDKDGHELGLVVLEK